ncbi:metallopeptidase family protein [Dictyobacter arantiisoli]|uniref:Metallopeptidase family protein n=1 Tax=Dictyobacter arantiisoli TaxID=2014874 RepID=A0A5A5T9U3_9CHLR|nr:metallopeptidase family protein [Dictyobacter arantiisoli]GCF07759.1 hypothetical protein KDI_13230 [Dictyobacter arantiisoli]
MSEDNPEQDQELEDKIDSSASLASLSQDKTGALFFRLLSFLLLFCILVIIILQLPINDNTRVTLYVIILLAGFFIIGLTLPKQASAQPEDSVEDEIEMAESSDTDPDAVPSEISDDYFGQLVQEAISTIPDTFLPYMANLALIIENEPDEATKKSAGIGHGQTLFGLYQGTPLTSSGYHYSTLPERITIYQKPIEQHCHGEPNRIRQQVRATVLHEVAHHFGIDHDEMPHWIK